MARKLRADYPGAIDHVMNPGDRRETTMTLKWIAERLAMGTGTNVANCLAKAKKNVKS